MAVSSRKDPGHPKEKQPGAIRILVASPSAFPRAGNQDFKSVSRGLSSFHRGCVVVAHCRRSRPVLVEFSQADRVTAGTRPHLWLSALHLLDHDARVWTLERLLALWSTTKRNWIHVISGLSGFLQ